MLCSYLLSTPALFVAHYKFQLTDSQLIDLLYQCSVGSINWIMNFQLTKFSPMNEWCFTVDSLCAGTFLARFPRNKKNLFSNIIFCFKLQIRSVTEYMCAPAEPYKGLEERTKKSFLTVSTHTQSFLLGMFFRDRIICGNLCLSQSFWTSKTVPFTYWPK